jgi:hypothetical protein
MRRIGVVSILLLVLAWLALDDITTDNATGPDAFKVEYSCLVICGVWFASIAIWLLAHRRAHTSIISIAAVALAVVAFWSLPHHYAPGTAVNYLGLISLAWFMGLAVWMTVARHA